MLLSSAHRAQVRETLLRWKPQGVGAPKAAPIVDGSQFGTLVAISVGDSTVSAMCEEGHKARYTLSDFKKGRCRLCP